MKKHQTNNSSEEEDDNESNFPIAHYHKSAVFASKVVENKNPIVEVQPLDISVEEDCEQLKPKLAKNKENIAPNHSQVYKKDGLSENKERKKQIATAFTFKLKNQTVIKTKKNDPVSLFQQTSTVWKKDKFLTSRGSNKQGRKLELSKRNKEIKQLL